MEALEGILRGFSIAIRPENLAAAFAGGLWGSAVGVLPGLGNVSGAAIVLSLTFGLPPETGLIMLAGIYYGTMYGGSTTSVLMNIPGEVSSVITAIEGYQMALKGRAGAALTVMALGSFFAATLSVVGVMFFTPTLADLAIAFGPADFFALMLVSLLVLARVSGGSFWAAMLMVGLGLVLGTIGIDPTSGQLRFGLGIDEMALGVGITPAAVGLFGLSEILILVRAGGTDISRPLAVKMKDLFPTRNELRRSIAPWARGGVIGFLIGLVPGPAATLSTFASYRVEKGVSRNKHEFGHGAIEGIAGPEAANNAAATSGFVPLLALGIPFSPFLALVVAAMMVHGIQPGPLLVSQHPDIFWAVIASMYIGNIALLILNLPLIGIWVNMLRIPLDFLIPGIVILCIVGPYAIRNSMWDVWVTLFFGVVGYMFRRLSFPLAPLILGLLLGPLIERRMLETLYSGNGNLGVFLSSATSKAIWGIAFLVLIVSGVMAIRRRKSGSSLDYVGNGGEGADPGSDPSPL